VTIAPLGYFGGNKRRRRHGTKQPAKSVFPCGKISLSLRAMTQAKTGLRIYFMGICGTAMGNAALLARAAGHEVLGADAGVYPPMSTVLAAAGITLHEGYDAERLAKLAPDLVVIGNAMSRGNAEVEWLLDTRALRFTSLPALLHDFVLQGRKNIVVSGTHGKTTTTALAAFLLREAGRDPGIFDRRSAAGPAGRGALGGGGRSVCDRGRRIRQRVFRQAQQVHPLRAAHRGDEQPRVRPCGYFRDLADVQRTFTHFSRIVPRNGFVVMNGDDSNLRALGPMGWTRVVRVGLGESCDTRIVDFAETAGGVEFKLLWRGQPWAQVKWAQPGVFNARNAAMAATAAGLALNEANPAALDLGALARFRGVKRRQEILLATPALTVIEDFGHHPTALAETLQSFRARFPGATLTAVFEPRSNTARVRTLQAAFMRALGQADEVYIGPVSRPEKLRDEERFDPEAVVQQLETQGLEAYCAATNAALYEKLAGNVLTPPILARKKARVVAFFSNGSFDGIIGKFVTAAKGGAA
jgi:UDP-N-acetylmuramate: L-alanyl-gamma-D-glutamyl-meso-diaminopimelate ligase